MTEALHMEVKQLTSLVEQARCQFDNELKHIHNMFVNLLRSFFDRYPSVKEISWRQFTPESRDRANEFAVFDFWTNNMADHHIAYQLNEVRNNPSQFASEHKKYFETLQIASAEINELMQQIDDGLFMAMFGPASSITVTRDGIKVEEIKF